MKLETGIDWRSSRARWWSYLRPVTVRWELGSLQRLRRVAKLWQEAGTTNTVTSARKRLGVVANPWAISVCRIPGFAKSATTNLLPRGRWRFAVEAEQTDEADRGLIPVSHGKMSLQRPRQLILIVRRKLIRLHLLALILAAALVVCFPPCRRAGIWLDESGRAAPADVAYEYDRFLWGYIPRVVWIGHVGAAVDMRPGHIVEGDGQGRYLATEYRMVLEGRFLAIEATALVLAGWAVWTGVKRDAAAL